MRSERGQSLTVFVSVVVFALLLVAGLVIDGGAQSAANRRAQLTAAAAARAAADETAAARLAGTRPDVGAAVSAARRVLASDPTLDASVDLLNDGRIRVATSTRVDTILLSLIGISTLPARGEAEAQLFGR